MSQGGVRFVKMQHVQALKTFSLSKTHIIKFVFTHHHVTYIFNICEKKVFNCNNQDTNFNTLYIMNLVIFTFYELCQIRCTFGLKYRKSGYE